MYPSNVDGLPEIEWECALQEASAAAEETFAKATLGFGAMESKSTYVLQE
jgi:hypothetical protein